MAGAALIVINAKLFRDNFELFHPPVAWVVPHTGDDFGGSRHRPYGTTPGTSLQWRITFRWEDGDAFDVDLVDYP